MKHIVNVVLEPTLRFTEGGLCKCITGWSEGDIEEVVGNPLIKNVADAFRTHQPLRLVFVTEEGEEIAGNEPGYKYTIPYDVQDYIRVHSYIKKVMIEVSDDDLCISTVLE